MIYYGSARGCSMERKDDPTSPDHGMKKTYTDIPPPAIFHGACRQCAVQYEDKLGIKTCGLCMWGPQIQSDGNKWRLESYERPETPEEYIARLKSVEVITKQYTKRNIDLYNKCNKEG